MKRTSGRKLDIALWKGVVMGALSLALGAAAALSGIGPQVAAAPIIAFMLGYTEERTRGTAMAFSCCAAIGGAAGAMLSGVHVQVGYAALLFLGATVGAVLAAKAASPKFRLMQRLGQTLGMLLAVYVLGEAVRRHVGGVRVLHWGSVQQAPLLGALVIGIVTGALSNALQLPSGLLLAPAMLYLADPSGITGPRPTAPEAVATSLLVIALASFLPTLAYSSRKVIDHTVGPWMAAGGALGGVVGGLVLGALPFGSYAPLIAFGLCAVLLCGWQAYRMT